jgi:hypothetical protein
LSGKKLLIGSVVLMDCNMMELVEYRDYYNKEEEVLE